MTTIDPQEDLKAKATAFVLALVSDGLSDTDVAWQGAVAALATLNVGTPVAGVQKAIDRLRRIAATPSNV